MSSKPSASKVPIKALARVLMRIPTLLAQPMDSYHVNVSRAVLLQYSFRRLGTEIPGPAPSGQSRRDRTAALTKTRSTRFSPKKKPATLKGQRVRLTRVHTRRLWSVASLVLSQRLKN